MRNILGKGNKSGRLLNKKGLCADGSDFLENVVGEAARDM